MRLTYWRCDDGSKRRLPSTAIVVELPDVERIDRLEPIGNGGFHFEGCRMGGFAHSRLYEARSAGLTPYGMRCAIRAYDQWEIATRAG